MNTTNNVELKMACNKLKYLISLDKVILPDAYYSKLWQKAKLTTYKNKRSF